jgi:urease alpha subunit
MMMPADQTRRDLYARTYGSTVGDWVRLGDTTLLVEDERDEAQPGDETLWGFGKTIRSMRVCWPRATGWLDEAAFETSGRVDRLIQCRVAS